ncbi:MAG: helix-turn-helix transcriptional regulator [Terracidiphilus sp.]|jgi:transcriptional regulator with XRE-family HTH domain
MASDICVRVGRRIRELRKEKGWSQQLLADHAELERAHLSRLEEGRREAGLRVLERIARALDVDVEDLVRRGSVKRSDG